MLGSRRTSIVDVFCGVVAVPAWPFGEPLVVELDIERGSYLIQDAHTNAPLPGLRRYLRRVLRGLPIGSAAFLTFDKTQGRYCARYWKWVQGALILAIKEFKEEHFVEWLDSLQHGSLQGQRSSAGGSAVGESQSIWRWRDRGVSGGSSRGDGTALEQMFVPTGVPLRRPRGGRRATAPTQVDANLAGAPPRESVCQSLRCG